MYQLDCGKGVCVSEYHGLVQTTALGKFSIVHVMLHEVTTPAMKTCFTGAFGPINRSLERA